jgi:hypothetical protein
MYCDKEILMDINGNSKWTAFKLNGGYHVCNKQEQPIVAINEQEDKPEAKAWVKEVMEGPMLKELEERLKKVEAFLFMAGAKKRNE